MNLLPKTTAEFSDSQYWNSFFKQRGKKAFEWYGEYEDLYQHLHKYIKNRDQILVVGCGNSKLSRSLFDMGCSSIISIDNSDVVIRQMTKANNDKPELKFLEMNALKTTFDNESFSVVLDKGTLDAMMTDTENETEQRVKQYFMEIGRLLRLGGRYICISLLQEHVLQALLENVTSGWMIRIIRCFFSDSSAYSSHPVFMVISTKLRPLSTSIPPMVEVCLTDDGKLLKVASVELVCEYIKRHQQAAFVCAGVKKGGLNGEEVVFEVASPGEEVPKYTVIIVDKKFDKKDARRMTKYAAFIVPFKREEEYLFSSEEGRQELLATKGLDRISMVVCHEDVNIETVKADLTHLISSLAPSSAPGPTYPILTTSNEDSLDDHEKTIVTEGTSPISGKYTIFDQKISDETRVRTLIFQDNSRVVQSQATLKQIKSRRGRKNVVDTGILNCHHHGFMVLGVNFALPTVDTEGSILVIGVGGGALCGYIHKLFRNSQVTGVDIDSAMIEVATKYFGLQVDERLTLIAADGLQFMKDAVSEGKKYDVILFDVDNKDVSVGMSCPPVSFVEPDILSMTHSLLNPNGFLIVNVVARSETLRKNVYMALSSEFGRLTWVQVPNEVGQIVYCGNSRPPSRSETARLQEEIEKVGFSSMSQLESLQLSVYPEK